MERDPNKDIQEVERQLGRAHHYAHNATSRVSTRLSESEHYLFSMLDILLEKGLITQEELEEKMANVKDEIEKRNQQFKSSAQIFVDDGSPVIEPDINCAERLHICKAACCSLRFPISVQDIDAGHVKWDYARPYQIRQSPEGKCVHLEEGSCACQVYHHRPKVCRSYSCRDDKRIWLDFDNMILNEESVKKFYMQEKIVMRLQEEKAEDTPPA